MWFYPNLFLICCNQVQKKAESQTFIFEGYEEVLGLV